MKKIATLLFFLLTFYGATIYAQESTLVVSDLNATPLHFNEADEAIELDVNFKIDDPSKLASVQVTLASGFDKANKETITLTRKDFRIWTRGELKVVICNVVTPSSLIGNCHYVEAKVIDNSSKSVILEGYPF